MCNKLIGGLTELLALICSTIPLVFFMTVSGVRVVLRFRVDVPYFKPSNKTEKIDPKPKKNKKSKSVDAVEV